MKLIKLYLVASLLWVGCSKEFLEERPDKGLLTPSKLADFRALLDNASIMNMVPALQQIANDELVVTDAGLASLAAVERNAYFWEKDVYQGARCTDWETPYKQVFYANVVLDGIAREGLDQNDLQTRQVMGTAYFHRGFAFFNLAQLFTVPYDVTQSELALGIPLPLSAEVNRRYGRGTLENTYRQLLADLKEAELLLPAHVAFKSRPNKITAQAMLARVYLIMGNYEMAEHYAEKVLEAKDQLLNYNNLNAASNDPFPHALPNGNEEVIFNAMIIPYGFASSSQVGRPIELYQLYENNDLRKQMYFFVNGNGVIRPKNTYTGPSGIFAGIAVDEIYYILAECLARRNEAQGAIDLLNKLLVTRWKTGTFVDLVLGDPALVIDKILLERRMGLVNNHGPVRWTDLRRLNKEERYAITISRSYQGKDTKLFPKDPRYVFPIPDNEINGNTMPQNER